MKPSFLLGLQEWLARRSKKPWACYETSGPDAEGRLSFSIRWNKAFIENLYSLGMGGLTEEETVQLFFLQTRMLPEGQEDQDDTINPSGGTPNLTSEANTFRRG